MAVTRSAETRVALEWSRSDKVVGGERRREFLWLAGASIIIAAGLFFVLAAKTGEFSSVDARLASGELLALNAPHTVPELERFLRATTEAANRPQYSQRLQEFLESRRPLQAVGALTRLRISGEELSHDARAEQLRRHLPPGAKMPASLPLLPLARVRPIALVRTPREFALAVAAWLLAYFTAFWLVHLIWRAARFRGDGLLLPTLHLLTGIGLMLMLTLRDPLRDTLEFRKFAAGAIGGCLILLLPLLRAFEPARFSRWTYTPLFAAFALFLTLLAFGSGPAGSDARVNLGPVQPVELIKILLVFFLAGYFATHWEWLRELRQRRAVPQWLNWLELPPVRQALPVMCAVACALALFFFLKDMGPALVMGLLFLSLFALARRRSGLAIAGLLLLVGGVTAGYRAGTPHTVADRVSMWLAPWNNDVHGGDQLAHALWAFATGGPWGSGPGWGDGSVIPAGHTDLVLPALAEEWGFCGVAIIALLFAVLVRRAFRIAVRAPDEYSLFLAAGLGTLLACEMLLISAGALGAIPLSGVVSPFLSAGNSAMLANFLICALLLAVSKVTAKDAGTPEDEGWAPLFGRPLAALGGVFLIACVLLTARAAYLEIWQEADLLARPAFVYAADGVKRPEMNPRLALLAAMIPRGNIYDRRGVLLATSNWSTLQKERERLQAAGAHFDESESPASPRHYPFATATLQWLGDWRSGERFQANNASLVEHDSNIKLQGYRDYRELAPLISYRRQSANPQMGALLARPRDVTTTIDIRLQLAVGAILGKRLAHANTRGAALVMNAATGDVLALVSSPQPQSDEAGTDALFDRARYGEYPPGSTFKLVTAAAALEKDPQSAQRIFTCRRLGDGRVGTTIVGWRRPIRDDVGDHAHGSLDMTAALTVSCNAYFAQLGTAVVGARALRDEATRFGIRAGSEQQVRGALPFASYGQGTVVATPLEMARVASAIAANGALPQGRWVFDGSDGRIAGPAVVMTAQSAAILANAMRRVVTNGTARSAFGGLPFAAAGKTGTAQLDRGEPHSWFTGFAPYDAPPEKRIVVAVIVEHGGYGAKTAAPIAREVMEAAANIGIIAGTER